MHSDIERVALILDRIRQDAPSWHVDFENQSRAHTVWADYPRMLFCGSQGTFEAAWQLASEYSTTRDLFIVSVSPTSFQIMKFDPDMVSEGHCFPRG